MPPVEEETPATETPTPQGSAPSRRQVIQDAANMGVLARQAIGNEFTDMVVDPKVCVNVAMLVEELTRTQDEAPASEDAPGATLGHAREEGRIQAVEAFAQEKADLLTKVAELEAALEAASEDSELRADDAEGTTHADEPEVRAEGDFQGPGQTP